MTAHGVACRFIGMTSRTGLLTAEEVAAELRVTKRTVRRLASDGTLHAIKVGAHWRFPAADVDAFLAGELIPAGAATSA